MPLSLTSPRAQSASRSSESAPYLTDGPSDPLPEPSPVKIHDFATGLRKSEATSPLTPSLDEQYSYEKAADSFRMSDAAASMQSDSSSMFGAGPSNKTYPNDLQRPFSAKDNGGREEINPLIRMPGSYQDTPGVSKEALPIARQANGQLDEIQPAPKRDVNYGEAL